VAPAPTTRTPTTAAAIAAVFDFFTGAGGFTTGGGDASGAAMAGLDGAVGTESADAGGAAATPGVDAGATPAAGRTPERDSLRPPIDTRPDSRSRFSRARSDFRSAACW